MNNPDLSCQEEQRREDVRAANLFGLDYVEVDRPEEADKPDRPPTLYVFFLGKAPEKFEQENLVLSGGRRIRDVQITGLRVQRIKDPAFDDYMEVEVNKRGDFSAYTLSAIETDSKGRPTGKPMADFDPRYSTVTFTFRAGCPSDLDCKPQDVCPPPQRTQPEINYLARDYASFKQLMLDRLALIMPAWSESHVPDLGVTLVELLAYTGDYLSYYQDAVATEAYLGTARERISVRRHARLVDYTMHEGCNARAWLTIDAEKAEVERLLDPAQIYFITAFPNTPRESILTETDLLNVPSLSYEVFQPLPTGNGAILIVPKHSEMKFYTWGDCQCCLAVGATSATLVDEWIDVPHPPDAVQNGKPETGDQAVPSAPSGKAGAIAKARASGKAAGKSRSTPAVATVLSKKAPAAAAGPPPGAGDGPESAVRMLKLKAGDVLIFEEVIGPKTGSKDDADPRHRQAVRLTKVTPAIDPLYHPYKDSFGDEFGQPVVEIEWATEDALTFPLCISAQAPAPDCGCLKNISVARGNVILVDHGISTSEVLGTVPAQSAEQKCPTCCHPAEMMEIVPGMFRPTLTQQPLTFSQPLPPPCSAVDFMFQDPRQALPWISLVSIPPGPACSKVAAGKKPVAESMVSPTAGGASPSKYEVNPLFTFDDLNNPESLAKKLRDPASGPPAQFLLAQLSAGIRKSLADWDGLSPFPEALRAALITDLTGLLETWSPKSDLLESGPEDRDFVVETDNRGYGHLRFGNGLLGRQPAAGTAFRADYRLGNGAAGNVGGETIRYIVFRQEKLSGVAITPRNPFPVSGGQAPEPIEEVKLFAPYKFRSRLERAVTAGDYAAIAQDNGRRWEARSALAAVSPEICCQPFYRLQRAKALLRWTGSWHTMQVCIDPQDTESPDQTLINEITAYLAPYRRIGYDLLVERARYVPLSVTLTVCVLPHYQRGHVEAAVLDALSNRRLPDGRLGFFHPDNLSFGDGIYVSRLVAAAQAVPGVQDVTLTELQRFESSEPAADDGSDEIPPNSVLALDPMEIAQLDNDPDFPENGRLVLNMRGGR